MQNLQKIKNSIEQDFNIKLQNFIPVEVGQVSKVFFATLNNKEIVIKYTKGFNSYPKEIFYYKTIQNNPKIKIEIPQLIDYIESPQNIEFPCIVMSKISGNSLAQQFGNRILPQNIAKQMGTLLKQLHLTKTNNFGYIDNSLNDLKGHCNTLKEFYETEYKFNEKINYLFDQKYINENQKLNCENILNEILNTNFQQSILIFNDYQQHHLFTDGTNITGIIDPGNAIASIKEHDIGQTLVFLHKDNHKDFLNSYGITDTTLVYKFAVLIGAFKCANNFKSQKTEQAETRLKIFEDLLNEI